MHTRFMTQAFILGAGLGTRLRPLTGKLPKPLVPLFHRPLAAWAADSCTRLGIRRFAINTHHLPARWEDFTGFFPQPPDVTYFHEPVLLETGGGLKNIEAWVGNEPLLVHNGDIFSDMPLDRLVSAHEASGLPATIALRPHGDAKHVAIDHGQTRVTDIRRMLGRADGTHVFTGIYCINPSFLARIPPASKVSVIPAFLELAEQGLLGAVVIDDGSWLDLGDRDSYLRAHRELNLGPAVHPLAEVHPSASVVHSVIGPGAVIGARASLRDSVVWPGCRVEAAADLDRCIVFSDQPATGTHRNTDL